MLDEVLILSRSEFPGRIPPFTRYVGRGTPFGNEFHIGEDGTRDQVIAKYIAKHENDAGFIALVKRELRGWNLLCHCRNGEVGKRCHGSWLAAVANDLPYDPDQGRFACLAVEC